MGLLTPLIKTVAKELSSKANKYIAEPLINQTTKTLTKNAPAIKAAAQFVADKTPAPIMQRLASNAVNDLTGFYSGKPLAQPLASTIGFGKTVINTIEQELNPWASKLFATDKISRTLQKVLKKELKFLDSNLVTNTVDKEMRVRISKIKVTKLKKRLKIEEDREVRKVLQAELKEAEKNATTELTDKDKKILKDSTSSAKAIEGQLGYNYLQTNQQKIASKALNDSFEAENYLGKGSFTLEDFVQIKDIDKPWRNKGVLNEQQMATFYNRIKKAQGIGDDEVVDMFIKKSSVSQGAGDLIHNINYKAPNSKKVTKIIKKNKKGFDSNEELGTRLKKEGVSFEKRDGVLYFQDSFKSSAYELGGVNAQHSVAKDGTMISLIDDINDMLGIKMPSGNNAISVTTPYIRNPLKENVRKQKKTPEQKLALKEKNIKSKQIAEKLGVKEKRNTGQQALTQNQRYTADQIANMKPDNLTMKEWLAYLVKVGVIPATGYGLLSGDEGK
jgi:hypothetical protein